MAIHRRHFLVLLAGSVGSLTLDACKISGENIGMDLAENQTSSDKSTAGNNQIIAQNTSGAFQLPPLPYAYNALEPHIDQRTMQFHHDKHHAAYVKNLNDAIAKYPQLQGKSAEDLLRDLDSIPQAIRTTVRNNGGGHVNHSMFWMIMKPNGGGEPTGAIANAINQNFGSFADFKQQFNETGTKLFGSGWVWLVRNKDGKLQVISTPNQDSPLSQGLYPIMGNDVWEHAYYLNYQNRRSDYLNAWWNVVNWDEINQRFQQANA